MLVRTPDGSFEAIDGREQAPAAATADMFVHEGKADPRLSQLGALAIAVPGALAAYDYASRTHGRIPLARQLETAAQLAANGFQVTRTLAKRLEENAGELQRFESSRAVFFKPDGVAEDWTRTGSVGEAERIPRVKVVFDKSGREAELFGAATSGQTDFFDTDGGLLFSGGITAARGHAGDNAGRDAIVGWTSNGAADRTRTPVFGCAIAETPRANTNLTP